MCPLLGNPGALGLRRYPSVVDCLEIDRSAGNDLRVPGLILLTIRFHLGRYIGESLLTLLFNQEAITRREQLPCTRVTTLLPTRLFLERFDANLKCLLAVESPLMATSPQRPLFWRTVHTLTLV